jgi:signal transduction histidine kinase
MPRRTDILLAAALLVPSLVQVLAVPIAPPVVGVIVALGSMLPIAWRRVRPVHAAVAGSVIWLVPTDGYVYLGYVAAFVLFYSLGAYVASGRTVAWVTGACAVIVIVATAMRSEVVGELFGALSIIVAPALAGRVVRRLREQAESLEELAGYRERAAVVEERERIARELHDVVAHGISVIAIQADAAEAALDRDPSLARVPLKTIRTSAKESLAEMRRLLGVLREGDDGSALAPQPGLDKLPELVAHAEATLEVEGTPRPLPASLDLSAFRIVQEALTNVRRHAGGAPASVRLTWAADELGLEIRDRGSRIRVNGNGASGGHGIVGMRERARVHGGTLDAGPAEDGGFRVRARLPL